MKLFSHGKGQPTLFSPEKQFPEYSSNDIDEGKNVYSFYFHFQDKLK